IGERDAITARPSRNAPPRGGRTTLVSEYPNSGSSDRDRGILVWPCRLISSHPSRTKSSKTELEMRVNPLTSVWFPGEPRPCKQACGDHDRENDWTDEKVLPSQNGFNRKADSESPLDAMHSRQSLRRNSAELPREKSQKYENYRNEEAESNIEVPKSP